MESARRVLPRRLVLEPVVLRKATCGPSVAACIKPYKVVGQHATASWWDSSTWLAAVLPSGRKLGLRFPAALALYWGRAMFSFSVHRFDPVPTIVVVTSLLLLVAMIWAY